MKLRSNNVPLIIGISFLTILITIELISILILNGKLVYTLDDAYIHLALAENILSGHYGVNLNEFSAPSSSIIWPFLITPISKIEYSLFFVNFIAAIFTVICYFKIINISFKNYSIENKNSLLSIILILLIILTNLTGLVYTGMEHSLQVLLVAIIGYGIIYEIEQGSVKNWFLLAIIFAPLVRFENLSVSTAAIGYLLINKKFKQVLYTTVSLSISLIGFSLFLVYLGLDPFPTSVVAKSSVVATGGKFYSIALNIFNNLKSIQGIALIIVVIALLVYLKSSDDFKRSAFAFITIIAISMHFIAGRYGWYNRYEIYILCFSFLSFFYLYGSIIAFWLNNRSKNFNSVKFVIGLVIFTSFFGYSYLFGLFTIPIASNNIYQQQYQMHRFVQQYYKKPIAVNDLGFVSYKNTDYVLDLYGLASKDVLNYRSKKDQNENWMVVLSEKYNVEFAMIYSDWFANIPEHWIKIGELRLSRKKITPAKNSVDFYVMNGDGYQNIEEKLEAFVETLPRDVVFKWDRH